jgi:hypothetical protein
MAFIVVSSSQDGPMVAMIFVRLLTTPMLEVHEAMLSYRTQFIRPESIGPDPAREQRAEQRLNSA